MPGVLWMLLTSPWVSRELWRHRTRMGSLELPPLLACSMPVPHLDQPNHLFLWACSQATKCSRRKLALKPIYHFQAQLDCQCCSAVLLLTHDWFPFSFSIAAVPISYHSFSGLQSILSIHVCIQPVIYWALTIIPTLSRGLWKTKKWSQIHWSFPPSKIWGRFSYPLMLLDLLCWLE